MPVEVSQSWAGPYHAPGYTVSKLAPQDAKADPNADLYAAIPWAKEAGLELVEDDDGGVVFMVDADHWCPKKRAWVDHTEDTEACCRFSTRAAALASPPPMPPGYVAAKPTLLDELAEVVRKASNELTHDARFFHNMALSVARRLLEREPSEGAIEAFAVEWERKGSTVPECLKAYNRSQLAELEGKA